jgi:hypothetical protein
LAAGEASELAGIAERAPSAILLFKNCRRLWRRTIVNTGFNF